MGAAQGLWSSPRALPRPARPARGPLTIVDLTTAIPAPAPKPVREKGPGKGGRRRAHGPSPARRATRGVHPRTPPGPARPREKHPPLDPRLCPLGGLSRVGSDPDLRMFSAEQERALRTRKSLYGCRREVPVDVGVWACFGRSHPAPPDRFRGL